jgi:hypothetical protein
MFGGGYYACNADLLKNKIDCNSEKKEEDPSWVLVLDFWVPNSRFICKANFF